MGNSLWILSVKCLIYVVLYAFSIEEQLTSITVIRRFFTVWKSVTIVCSFVHMIHSSVVYIIAYFTSLESPSHTVPPSRRHSLAMSWCLQMSFEIMGVYRFTTHTLNFGTSRYFIQVFRDVLRDEFSLFFLCHRVWHQFIEWFVFWTLFLFHNVGLFNLKRRFPSAHFYKKRF
jgi:hypothetical protein